MVYIHKGEHDDPHGLPQQQCLEGFCGIEYTLYSHTAISSPEIDSFKKLEYIYQHFQDSEKIYELETDAIMQEPNNTSYPHINNDINYGLFEDVINSYYLDSQIKDDFNCNQECYTDIQQTQQEQQLTPFTHAYNHITQHINNLDDSTQQNTLYTMAEDASLLTSNTTPCDFNITKVVQNSNTISKGKSQFTTLIGIHSQSKHKYRNIFGDSNIQYHDFNNGDALTFKDKYTAILHQELQNPYWCLHDPITTKNYKISSEMVIEIMPHTRYFSGSIEAVTKINHVPYQTIEYDDKGMFQAKLMDDTQVQIFIDNEATPSILPLSMYKKYPILQMYPKTKSNTPIYTGGGMIESHFWIEIPLKLDNHLMQIKALVCDSECPYDIVLGCTSLAQLSTWQDYASKWLYIQQISIPLIARNNV